MVSLFGSLQPSHCQTLAKVDYGNFGISLFILIGILVSYLPQHIRIIRRGSSYGLSPYFVLLGTTSGTCAFANILVLPASRVDMSCCRQISGFSCFAALLGVAQVGVQWCCFGVILLLFLIFFPKATPPTTHPEDKSQQPSFRTALTVVLICTLHAILTALISLIIALRYPALAQSWANVLGITATILSSIQYFPQIWTTWKLRSVESLSIPMMMIQTPGSFVWAASLAKRLGPEGWSAWGVYVVTGCLQGTLLGMGSWFEIEKRRSERKLLRGRIEEGVGEGLNRDRNAGLEGVTEESPLLRSVN